MNEILTREELQRHLVATTYPDWVSDNMGNRKVLLRHDAALRAEIERLRGAIPELVRHVALMRGHDHFDRTGQCGRGCEKCISNKTIITEAEEIAIRALKGTP